MKCSVLSCSNDTRKYYKKHGITFHPIPKDAGLKAAWLDAIGWLDCESTEKSTVCSEHFRDDDFYITKNGLKRVKTGAIPFVEMSPEELASPVALRVCRVCLVMDSKMYNLTECKLDNTFAQLVGVSVATDDKLPPRICWECAQRLLGAARFRRRALRAQGLMMESLRTNEYLTVQDIKSIDRAANGLTSPLIVSVYDNDHSDVSVREDGVKNECVVEEWKGGEPAIDLPCDMEVDCEVKNEEEHLDGGTEIFCEEFPDHFESDDDRKLSELSDKTEHTDRTERVRSKQKKAKKRKEKAERRVRVRKKEQKLEADEDPSVIIDKYKISDVKRRKTQEGPNESLFTISTLTYEEQIAEVERRQESASYRSAPFKCGVCYRGFMVRERYDAHSVRHSEASGAFPCLICKTRLRSARALRKHLTAQHTEQFSCKGCPFVTRNRGVAREHEKWHAGTKYQCPHCPSEFDKLTTYMGHIRIKHVSDFVCELCGYTFVSKKGIDVHKKKKHRAHGKHESLEGPYCETCDVRFISEEAHARHLKLSSRHSSDNDPNRIRNDSQSMSAERNGRVSRRVERRPAAHNRDRSGLGREPGPVTCEQCGVQLGDLRLYAQHFRRVHPDKNRTKYPAMKTPAMCEQCGRIFQSMALLKDHMWVHTGEKRFKCDRCDKSFTQKTNLVFHMRVHSNARPSYECPLCGKHFAFLNNRRRHMFIHTGLKPFKCDTCGKCFTTAGEQRAHLDHVHLKKPWPKRARQAHALAPPHYKGMGPSMED